MSRPWPRDWRAGTMPDPTCAAALPGAASARRHLRTNQRLLAAERSALDRRHSAGTKVMFLLRGRTRQTARARVNCPLPHRRILRSLHRARHHTCRAARYNPKLDTPSFRSVPRANVWVDSRSVPRANVWVDSEPERTGYASTAACAPFLAMQAPVRPAESAARHFLGRRRRKFRSGGN